MYRKEITVTLQVAEFEELLSGIRRSILLSTSWGVQKGDVIITKRQYASIFNETSNMATDYLVTNVYSTSDGVQMVELVNNTHDQVEELKRFMFDHDTIQIGK